jgi:hypothetical protein
LADLRGRFSGRLDAYIWQYETLWSRATHSLLVGISPTHGSPPEPYGGLLHDYAVANQAMVFWLDPNAPAERTLFERILGDMAPNTPYFGWFPRDVRGEFIGTELTSAHGVYVLAADYFSNMTVFSGVRPQATPMTQASAAVPRLENRIYVTFTVTEGDNLQYTQHRMRRLWDDPGRGRVPLNWTLDPLLLDAAPTVLEYYQHTRTPNDLLISGPSGAGYIYPNAWPAPAFGAFTRQSAAYMRRTGMNIVWVLNRTGGRSVELAPARAGAYIEDVAPLGVLLNYENYTVTTLVRRSLPQAVTLGVGSAREARHILKRAAKQWRGDVPCFLSVGVLAWTMTPSDVAQVAEALSPRFQVVRGDAYFALARTAFGVPYQAHSSP